MSKITAADVKKIARLARIEVSENDIEPLSNKLGSIISWVDQLNEVNTENVSPLTSVCNMNLRLNEDKVSDGNIAQDVLQSATNPIYGYFSVPKVIE
jgi:aspartyl-tRNA(Asn)/glutamyl-tRNA(Gln) amidotransferase subunit C